MRGTLQFQRAALLALLWLVLQLAAVFAGGSLVLFPPKEAPRNGPSMALVFAGGFSLGPQRYRQMIAQTQAQLARQHGVRLWAVLPKFPLDLPVAQVVFARAVRHAIAALSKALPPDRSVPVFYGGHSRGGQLMLEFVHQLWSSANGTRLESRGWAEKDRLLRPFPPRGLVLCASGVVRKLRGSLDPLLPILTLGGDLDGLFRVMRLAESFYHAPKDRGLHPVLLVPGANHMSFTSGSLVPPFVAANDISAEITSQQAAKFIGEAIASFLVTASGRISSAASLVHARQDLARMQAQSEEFFKPLLHAMTVEGSYHLRPLCAEVVPRPNPCWTGSPWTPRVALAMLNLPQIRIHVNDTFWKAQGHHYAYIENTCKRPDGSCLLQLHTATQNVYNLLDSLDTGLSPIGAQEIRVKMKSTEAVRAAAGFSNGTSNDGENHVCRRLNQMAIDFAHQNAPLLILARFQKQCGVPLVAGEDLPSSTSGPDWIFSALRYTKLRGGKTMRVQEVKVQSPTLQTPLEFPLPGVRGVHYCKLLSPARALEWLYTDGLKLAKPHASC